MWVAVVGAVALFALLPEGDAVTCFQCKSWEDPGCWDVKTNDTKSPYAKFCDDDRIPVGAAIFCRTQRQKIKDGNGTERIWRRCGWEEHKTKTGERSPKPCYYFSDGHHEETACQCFYDYCNTAVAGSPAPLTLLLAALTAAALAVRPLGL